jgi:hypothetical protein
MAKLKPDAITDADLIEYLNKYSDFAFEVKVLNSLVASGFHCEHGGTYDDPATSKPREFDIRATKTFYNRLFLRLAVECKNLKENCPLLVSCLPRRRDEAFYEVVYSVDPATDPIDESKGTIPAMLSISQTLRLNGFQTMYRADEPVGKSCDQIGRLQNGDLSGSDADIYDKWAQALSSAHDLTWLACNDGRDRASDPALSTVFPIVVVPDGRLWVTHFDKDGNRVQDPKQVERCPYFIGRPYFHRGLISGQMTLSHLEFVTYSGLTNFVNYLCGSEHRLEETFCTLDFRHVLKKALAK